MLELLLVIGIASVLVTGVIQIFNDFFERSINRRAGNHILKIQNSAEEFVAANFSDIWSTDVPNLGDITTFTVANLIAEGFLPDNYNPRNVFRQQSLILIRNIGTGFVGGQAVEVITVTQDEAGNDRAFANDRIVDAAIAAGPRVGVISNVSLGAGCCAGNIQSLYNEWSVVLADFAAELNITNHPDRGYLASYGTVSFSDTFNTDHLYRVEITGQPQVNRMETNLNMDQHHLAGVGVVTADNVSVGYEYNTATNTWTDRDATLTVLGANTGTGSFTPFALTVDQALVNNGNAQLDFKVIGDPTCQINAAGNIISSDGSANPATDCEVVGGDFVLSGDGSGTTTNDLLLNTLTIRSPDFSTDPASAGNMVARRVDIDALGAPKNIEANFDDVSVLGNTTTSDFSAFEVEFRGPEVNVDQIQTGSANFVGSTVTTRNLIAGKVRNVATTNLQDTAIENAIENSRGLNAGSMNISDQFFIGDLDRCDSGCTPVP